MGTWGYFSYPSQPRHRDEMEERWAEMEPRLDWDDWADEQMAMEDSFEEIATDESGWGAWMGGEL